MFLERISVIFIVCLISSLSIVALAQAAPPRQEGTNGSTLGETLNLDDEDNTEPLGKNNLGTIMSGQKDGDTLVDETPDEGGAGEDTSGDTPTDGTPDEGGAGEDTPGDTPTDDAGLATKEHPVASAIAEYFGVTYSEVMALHEAGNGFGNIAKAYFFADKLAADSLLTPADLLEAAHGTGWGNVLKENKIQPGAVGNGNGHQPEQAGSGDDGPPGLVKKGNNSSDSAGPELMGQSGDNGNGKGNNGNGNGNNGHGNNGNGHDNEGGGKGNGKK
ncbi:MAG: hypothetical protein AB1801_13865 [Chloroflexota bacterium]